MAGACPVSLSIAVANAGGMGAMGARLHGPGRDPRMGGLMRVMSEDASIVAIGIIAGCVVGYAMAGVAASLLANMRFPGALPLLAAATVLAAAAIAASLMPAARAARVDVLQALRSE